MTTGHEINLSLDRTDGRHLTHPVKNPKKVVFRQDLQGAHEGIDITSADGKLTAVRFRIAARPETLDGVLGDARQENQRPSDAESARSQRSAMGADAQIHEMAFHIPIDRVMLEGNLAIPAGAQGNLAIPAGARGTILFAHGSGSSRHSPRNRYVARVLQNAGFGTLLMDLLTTEEETLDDQTAALRFDINLLARRLIGATWWLQDQSATANLPIGYFGASTGAAAALVAAAAATNLVSAVVSRGGRPDLAGDALHKVIAPTLLIVGGNDMQVIELNRRAFDLIPAQKKLEIVPGATHLFEEPGALESVANLAANWFEIYLSDTGKRTEAA